LINYNIISIYKIFNLEILMINKYYEELYENAPLAYQSLDKNGRIIIVNSAWLEILGYTKEEVIGKPFADFLTPEAYVTLQKNFPNLCSNGIIHDVEFDIIRKDGEVLNVVLDGKVSYTEAGVFKQTHCIYKPKEQSERIKGDVEPTYHKIFQNSNACMMIFDPETHFIVDANKKACELYGYSYKELVTMRIGDLNSDSRDQSGLIEKFISGEGELFDIYQKDKKGREYCVEFRPANLRVGDRKFIYSIFHDITDRKEQERLLSLNRHISDIFLSEDPEILYQSLLDILLKYFDSTFGLVGFIDQSGNLAASSMTKDIFDKCQVANKDNVFPRESWGGIWAESLLNGSIQVKTDKLSFPHGHIKLYNAMSVPVMKNKKAIGIIILGNKTSGFGESEKNDALSVASMLAPIMNNWRDNYFYKTELEKMNRDLEYKIQKEVIRRKKQEEILFEQKKFVDMGQMISAIAHQWRQPLNNIYLITQLMQESFHGADVGITFDELYQKHSELVRFMSNTINDFRNFFSAKKEKTEFSLVKELIYTFELVRAQYDSNGIYLLVACRCDVHKDEEFKTLSEASCDDCSDMTYGTQGELRQVILNILSNAKDAIQEAVTVMPSIDKAIKIRINVSREKYLLEFYNSGFPIKKEVLKRIYDPYFTTKEEGKGTGIGLYMTRLIVEGEMKGKIYCRNEEQGVRFYLEIPRRRRIE